MPTSTIEFTGPAIRMSDADMVSAARAASLDPALAAAVRAVEAGPKGPFHPDGRPVILFEAHKFAAHTKQEFNLTHPGISSKSWNQKLYFGGIKEYLRLYEAMTLDRAAALQSASWGAFQILGENYKACGCTSVEEFVKFNVESEARQFSLFLAFCTSQGLMKYLKTQDWAGFARRYNGPGYLANRYDSKLAEAYAKARRNPAYYAAS